MGQTRDRTLFGYSAVLLLVPWWLLPHALGLPLVFEVVVAVLGMALMVNVTYGLFLLGPSRWRGRALGVALWLLGVALAVAVQFGTFLVVTAPDT